MALRLTPMTDRNKEMLARFENLFPIAQKTMFLDAAAKDTFRQFLLTELTAKDKEIQEAIEDIQTSTLKFPAVFLGMPEKTVGYNEGYNAALQDLKAHLFPETK